MNNDLRYHEDENQNEEGYVVSVSQSESKTKETEKKTTSLVSVVLGLFRKEENSDDEDVIEKPIPFPRPQTSLKFLFFTICIAIILFLSYYFVNLKSLLILSLVLASMAIPIVTIMFFYELNTRCNVNVGYLIMCFFSGSVLYLLTAGVVKYISLTLVFDSMNSVFSEIVINLIKFVVAIFMIKILKVRDNLGGILITVCLYMGFAFCRTLDNLFSKLFINAINDGKTYSVIVGEIGYLRVSMRNLLSKSFYYGFLMPFIDLGSAVVIGHDLSTAESLLYKGENYPRSTYLTIVIAIVLASLFEINSMISLVKYAFKIFSTLMITTLSIQTLNQTLANEKFESE